MKRAAILLLSIGAVVLALAFIRANRRDGQTFEGRSASQWLRHFAAQGVDPDPRVVDHFGTNAVPLLFAELENFSLSEKKTAREKALEKARNQKGRERSSLAWCKLLMQEGEPAFEAILTGAEVKDVYKLFIVLENDALKQALARTATNGTLEAHRERATILQRKLYSGPTSGVSP